MQAVRTREATEKDIPLIQQLIKTVWPKAYSHILTEAQTEYMLEMMYSDASLTRQMTTGHHFLIAETGGRPIAFASWEKKPDDLCKLHKIYVLPLTQGSGVGKQLIWFIRDKAVAEGCKRIALNVNRHNSAKSFYEKLGFVAIAEEDIDIGNGYFMNDYVMQMEI